MTDQNTTNLSDNVKVELLLSEEHVSAGISVKHELPFSISSQCDERQSCSGARIKHHTSVSNAVLAQDRGQHAAELVVAKLPNESSATSEPRDGDGDVRRSAAGCLKEARRLGEGHARRSRDEIYQHLTKAYNQLGVGHGGVSEVG